MEGLGLCIGPGGGASRSVATEQRRQGPWLRQIEEGEEGGCVCGELALELVRPFWRLCVFLLFFRCCVALRGGVARRVLRRGARLVLAPLLRRLLLRLQRLQLLLLLDVRRRLRLPLREVRLEEVARQPAVLGAAVPALLAEAQAGAERRHLRRVEVGAALALSRSGGVVEEREASKYR